MPQNVGMELSELQHHAARLYGTGMKRAQIARALIDYLSPTSRGKPMEQRMALARTKLRRWERRQLFRDEVYKHAVMEVDMNVPGVLQGVIKKARRGRVDAARLVLEVTGRHNPKGDTAAPAVIVHIDGIPRPQVRADEIGPDVVYEEHEVEEVDE